MLKVFDFKLEMIVNTHSPNVSIINCNVYLHIAEKLIKIFSKKMFHLHLGNGYWKVYPSDGMFYEKLISFYTTNFTKFRYE